LQGEHRYEGRCEPVTKPRYSLGGREEQVINCYRGSGDIGLVLGGSPPDGFSFQDAKSDPEVGALSLDNCEVVLKGTDIRSDASGTYCDCEVIDL